MAHARKRIDFDYFEQNLREIFDEVRVNKQAVVVERDGELFQLVEVGNDADLFAGYDVHHVQDALQAAAGILKDVDRGELLRDIYEQRGQDTTGRPA